MEIARIQQILGRFAGLRALVIGDFFLDRYLRIDPALAERSVETGLEAHQVFDVVASPGAAGTVTANLRALGLSVAAIGIVGDDGEGYELRQGLRAISVDDHGLVVATGRRTPTYTKPLVIEAGQLPRELERLDIRTRAPLASATINALIDALRSAVAHTDLVIIADQMPEPEHGAIGARVRDELERLAGQYPGAVFLADSRERIGLFRNVVIKPNVREATRALAPEYMLAEDPAYAQQAGEELHKRTGKPLFVTLGPEGILALDQSGVSRVAAAPVDAPIDVVGAGDSVMAAIGASLCAGATFAEAALCGNLAAAVTVRQIGTTGTASPAQMLEIWQRYAKVAGW